MNCSYCGNIVVKDGVRSNRMGGRQSWHCKYCNRYFSTPLNEPTEQLNSNLPKILLLDIETSPLLAWVWSRWKQNIHLEQTVAEWFMLTWSAKWLLSNEMMSARLTGEEVLRQDDKRIVSELWKLINDCDVVIGHNLVAFDIAKTNSRFIINGLNPPEPYKTIDTKLIAAKQFGFSSNKLDALAGYFGFEKKLDTDFELWANCMKGDEKSLEYMERYNRNDVVVLEEVYLKLRPWIKSHPNMGLYMEEETMVCSACGNKELTYLPNRYYYTQVAKYPLFRCNKCKALTRGRKTEFPKELNKTLGTSIPK